MSKRGFTLAEVLITLGIIGIVAALTIPTLMQNYKFKAWDTAANVFERKLEEALKAMNTQQVLAGYSNTISFVNELANHIKIIKICDNNDTMSCFEDEITWNIIDISNGTTSETIDMKSILNAADMGQNTWNTEVIGVQFANGVTGLISYNPDCKQDPYNNQITGTSCISLIYDTDGYKSPNTYTKDVKSINAKLNECAFKDGSTYYGAPFKPDAITAAECEAEKDKLGINYCNTSFDNWAGAVKTCGGVDKVPSMTQLTEIAKYLYNTPNITLGGNTNGLSLDFDKVAQLGFSVDYGTDFTVWSNEEATSTSDAPGDIFVTLFLDYGVDNNYYSYYGRNNNGIQAVCIVN